MLHILNAQGGTDFNQFIDNEIWRPTGPLENPASN